MRVGQSLRLGLCFDLLDSVQSDLSQLGDGGLVELDLGQVVLLDPRDGVVLSMGQRGAKNKKFEDLLKRKLNLKEKNTYSMSLRLSWMSRRTGMTRFPCAVRSLMRSCSIRLARMNLTFSASSMAKSYLNFSRSF